MVAHKFDSVRLLRGGDVAPVHEVHVQGPSPFLLVCDHFGRMLPQHLGDLGLSETDRNRHIAYDIGIAEVAEQLAAMLDAHLIAQRYSRLAIDCNRRPWGPASIAVLSETTEIPGNARISPRERDARRHEIFDPYHRCINDAIVRRIRERRPTVLVSLHSFTPVYCGVERPWHVGVLYRDGQILPQMLLTHLGQEGDLVVGDNEPYAVSDATDYTIPMHGEARGLIHSGIEIRQDLIGDAAGQQQWAERLARIFSRIEEDLARRRREQVSSIDIRRSQPARQSEVLEKQD
ncbi:MAG: N-formylglutamate amidohydrolase [Alphaproteobacteria bacterium]|nr:N-formylglutamate amidohydrolase [Alphaproteobacteria bacterium]